jgi:hypothetical protein
MQYGNLRRNFPGEGRKLDNWEDVQKRGGRYTLTLREPWKPTKHGSSPLTLKDNCQLTEKMPDLSVEDVLRLQRERLEKGVRRRVSLRPMVLGGKANSLRAQIVTNVIRQFVRRTAMEMNAREEERAAVGGRDFRWLFGEEEDEEEEDDDEGKEEEWEDEYGEWMDHVRDYHGDGDDPDSDERELMFEGRA